MALEWGGEKSHFEEIFDRKSSRNPEKTFIRLEKPLKRLDEGRASINT